MVHVDMNSIYKVRGGAFELEERAIPSPSIPVRCILGLCLVAVCVEEPNSKLGRVSEYLQGLE